jgi:hypothetical protein
MAKFALKRNERDEVVLVHGKESVNLGPKGEACEEMLRFLRELDVVERARAVPEFT